ncbi:MAG: membrane protein insertase YidC [Bacteroidetes bacterium]|nr:membrane protein insertase YidC [Bacteroidota bacterium]MBP6316303.1 membrane protein insertase YidC [Chitinophagaceae bacterium]
MDKNTVIGFGLLMLMLIGYIFYNQNGQTQLQKQHIADSIAKAKLAPIPTNSSKDTTLIAGKSALDTNAVAVETPEVLSTIENDDIIITFTNKGGYATKAELKKFKTYDHKPLILFEGDNNVVDYGFKSAFGGIVHSKTQSFKGELSGDKKAISFVSNDMVLTYKLEPSGYMLSVQAKLSGCDRSQNISMQWKSQSLLTEKDIESQKLYTQICYNLEKEGYDYFTIKEKKTHDLQEAVKWLSFKQHYFNTTLITDSPMILSAKVHVAPSEGDTALHLLSNFDANMVVAPRDVISYKMFLGPNDYKLLKSYGKDLEEIIPLSYGIFGFVKYINIWLILPIFNFLAKIVSSYGMVILFLTIIIRLLMSPFTYKSYVSSAKMKALKPELDELREKLGDDKQAFGVEQMKLYRQAGVNPLGGCLPALLQLPVFFALLSFFPHAIELRQSKFLWAKDLSTYDSILNLPFSIPFYGDHVSLFTIGFVVTSLILALYSMNMTADQSNPMMKYLPFIMPVMFLGIFNKLPASLTFYYFVSNVITIALQFVIQNYIIDPEKIHAQIQAKKKEPAKENKLMARMAEMQKQQQERNKNLGKK